MAVASLLSKQIFTLYTVQSMAFHVCTKSALGLDSVFILIFKILILTLKKSKIGLL